MNASKSLFTSTISRNSAINNSGRMHRHCRSIYSSIRNHALMKIRQNSSSNQYPNLLSYHARSRTLSPPKWPVVYQRKLLFSSKHDGDDNGSSDDDSSNDTPFLTKDAPPAKQFSIPGAQKGGKKLAIVFTCTVCNTRAAKQFTENAYQNGVVIVQCPGCNNRHLIADNLGFFSDEDDGWNIEKAMKRLGKNVNVVNDDNVLELSLEDIYGEENLEDAVKSTVDDDKADDEKT